MMVVILILGTKWLLFVPIWCFSGGLDMEMVVSVPVLRGVVSVWQPAADIGAGSQPVV
jgi:hypothetical protein